MNAVFKPALPVRPATQDVTVNDETVVVMLESNRDADTITEYTFSYTTGSDYIYSDGITVDFEPTCTVKLYSEVTGEVIAEDVEPTPEWAHYFIASEVEEGLRDKETKSLKEFYASDSSDDLCHF